MIENYKTDILEKIILICSINLWTAGYALIWEKQRQKENFTLSDLWIFLNLSSYVQCMYLKDLKDSGELL